MQCHFHAYQEPEFEVAVVFYKAEPLKTGMQRIYVISLPEILKKGPDMLPGVAIIRVITCWSSLQTTPASLIYTG